MTRAVTRSAQRDNRIDFTDQAMFLGLRATGQEAVMQVVWIYERPVDLDGVRRFHEHIGHGLLGRRIERSALPFGRHRWVSALGPQSDLDFAAERPRAELGRWIDERSTMPLDPEYGPAWHVGVLPKQGAAKPWRVHQNYVADMAAMRFGRLEDGVMRFAPRPVARRAA